jgi:hypothetical protein
VVGTTGRAVGGGLGVAGPCGDTVAGATDGGRAGDAARVGAGRAGPDADTGGALLTAGAAVVVGELRWTMIFVTTVGAGVAAAPTNGGASVSGGAPARSSSALTGAESPIAATRASAPLTLNPPTRTRPADAACARG